MPTILVVEDDPVLRETLVYNLQGQAFKVEAVQDGLAALEAARRLRPDLIVLDLMLPKLDGIEVCRILRQEMDVPILMLTARDDEIERVMGSKLAPTITSPSPSACAS
jgi:DNA-binding response OmpR family regulator